MKQQLSKHRAIGAALAVACSAVMAFTVSAETAGGVTLNLSTDKTSYTSGESVNVSVSVRNDNDYAINNVSVASTLPSGFIISGNSSSTISAGTIAAGGSFDGSYSISMSTGGTSVTPSKPNPSPNPNPIIPAISKNDSADNKTDEDDKNFEDVSSGAGVFDDSESIRFSGVHTGKFAVVFLLILAAVYGIAMLIKHRKGLKKFLSLFMAVGIIIPFCAEWGTVDVSAESGTVSASAAFTYGGVQYSVSANAAYEYDVNEENNSNFSLEYAANQVNVIYQKGDNNNSVTKNVTLATDITEYDSDIGENSGITVAWQSNDPYTISNSGIVSRPSGSDTLVGLKAVISDGKRSLEKNFTLNVVRRRNINNEITDDNLTDDILEKYPDAYISYDKDFYAVSISGQFSDIVVNNVDDAQDVVQSIRSLVGIENAYTELAPLVINENVIEGVDYGKGYTFEQVYNGYSVSGMSITVCTDSNGNVTSMSAGLCPTEKLKYVSTVPVISKADAEITAVNHYSNVKADTSVTELVIFTGYSPMYDPVLAYYVNVAGTGINENVYISSQNGAIIDTSTNILDAKDEETTGCGVNELGSKVEFPVSGSYKMYDKERNIMMFYGSAFKEIESEDNTWEDKTAVSAYTNVIKAYDWYHYLFARDSVNGNGKKIQIHVHCEDDLNNAHWTHGSVMGPKQGIYFFDNDINSAAIPTTAAGYDIVVHEYTHGVIQYLVGNGDKFPYKNATGAINEAYADIMGCLADGDWEIGEDWLTPHGEDGRLHSLRSIPNPKSKEKPDKLYGEYYLDYTKNSGDNGGVHTNSTIISHAAYLMNSRGVGSKITALWYGSIMKGFNAKSDFYTVRRNVLKQAEELNYTAEQMKIVKEAFDEVNIAEYGIKCFVKDKETGEKVECNITVSNDALTDSDRFLTKQITDESYFFAVPKGSYKLLITADGYEDYTTTVESKADFEEGYVFKLEKNKGVHVRIVDSDTKEPIEGANVTIRHSSIKDPNGISGVSDSDGKCLIPFPLETTVDINVSAEGYKEYGSTAESKLALASEFDIIELVKSEIDSIEIDETKSTELQRIYPLNTTQVNREGGYLKVTYSDGTVQSVALTNIGVDIDTIDGTKIGIQELTVTYMEKSCILTVTVVDSQVEDFEINDPNIEYSIGDDFQREKWSITVTYTDNASAPETINLADDSTITVTGFDSATAGVKTVSITYGGITKTVDVTVKDNKEVSDIKIRRHPDKAFYSLGEELDLTGGQISVIYADGTSDEIDMSSAAVTGFDSFTEGRKMLTVTYRGKQALFEVWVAADLHTPYQIYFASTYNTIDNLYSINETLTDDDIKNAKITVAYMDGYTETVPITTDMIEGLDTTVPGVHSCVIVYNDMYLEYYYAVRPPVGDVGSIVANSKPVTSTSVYKSGKTTYMVDEEFDNTGFKYILSHGNNPLYDTFDITECTVVSFQSRFSGTYIAQVVVYDYKHTLSNYVVNIKITVQ